MAIVFLEVIVLHVPDLYRVAWRRDHRNDASLDRAARSTALVRQLRADLDAARSAAARPGLLTLERPGDPVTYTATAGGVTRADAAGHHTWSGVTLTAAAETTPRGHRLEVTLLTPGSPPLPVSRLWAVR